MKLMNDEQVVEILTDHGKQFCPLLRFEVTEIKGTYKLTDEKWSWSLYVTLDHMLNDESESPLEWVRITFTRFNDYLESIRRGIKKHE